MIDIYSVSKTLNVSQTSEVISQSVELVMNRFKGSYGGLRGAAAVIKFLEYNYNIIVKAGKNTATLAKIYDMVSKYKLLNNT